MKRKGSLSVETKAEILEPPIPSSGTLPSASKLPIVTISNADGENQMWDLTADVAHLEERKTDIERTLAILESRIYKLETSYLHQRFNAAITKGYDFIYDVKNLDQLDKHLQMESQGYEIKQKERIFSNSSSTFEQALEKAEKLNSALPSNNTSNSASRVNSPVYLGKPVVKRDDEKEVDQKPKKRRKRKRRFQ